MARRVIRSRFVRPAKGKKVWFAQGFSEGVMTGGAKNLLTVLNAAALALRPFTILRTRLLLTFSTDQSSTGETPQGAFGMLVVSDQASGVGITALPGPVTNTDAPFFVYEGLINQFIFGDATGFEHNAGLKVIIDSKAMRKVGNNEDVVQLVELRSAPGASVAIEGRMLVEVS